MLDMLLVISDGFGSFFGTLRDVDAISPDRVPMIGIISILGGLILTRYTGSLGSLTVPINSSALFIGAMLSNWLLQNVTWTVSSPIEAPLFLSIIGMTLASFCMMWWLQGDSMRS